VGTPARETDGSCDLNKCRGPPLARAESIAMTVDQEAASERRKRLTRASCPAGSILDQFLTEDYGERIRGKARQGGKRNLPGKPSSNETAR
jgi:hypothetical protein